MNTILTQKRKTAVNHAENSNKQTLLRRAKIVCTLGPATSDQEVIKELIDAGMDVARLNFSHGTHEDHEKNYRKVRKAAEEKGKAVGILADLQGPKIRLGTFKNGKETWKTGEHVTITVDDVEGTHDKVSTTYKDLANDARPDDRLLVDDGNVELKVISVNAHDVLAEVIEGGVVSDHKGVNLPGMKVSAPALSDKDVEDLEFALHLGVDLIALSFVRAAHDIDRVHEVMDRVGGRIPVIVKLEKPEAVDDLENIIKVFDAVMVARGDLGVEMPLEDVPEVQKRAIQLSREYAKPVIVATQMLESMIHNWRPTRAEASDVANAVLDGADAVMLSGETSVGKFPIQTVQTMSRIVTAAENANLKYDFIHQPRTRSGIISVAARDIAGSLPAKALVAFTVSGDTVRRLSRLHSVIPILAFTPNNDIRNQLALTWGTETSILPWVATTDQMIKQVDNALLALDTFELGDAVVIVAGSPPGSSGKTNTIRVHYLGEQV